MSDERVRQPYVKPALRELTAREVEMRRLGLRDSGERSSEARGLGPRVSIVIASYQYGRFLGEAIESALSQTVPCEVIVVDDGSTDGSVDIARKYPVTVVALEHQGVCEARNHGAKLAKGDYLLFLDADDVLLPNHVETCLRVLTEAPSKIAYAYTPMEMFGAETGRFDSRPFSARSLAQNNFVNVSALVRREAFERAGGFNPEMKVGLEDYELWLRMLDHGYEGVFVEDVALQYRRHGPSRNGFSDEARKQMFESFRRKFPKLYEEFGWYLLRGDGVIRRERCTKRSL